MTVIDPVIPLNPITPYLIALADCVCAELTSTGAGAPCWCGVYPGLAVSFEFCTECADDRCGMGWVRPFLANPYDTFPIATLDVNCRKDLAWGVEVGAARCIPVPENGEIVPPEEMNLIAVEQMQDAWALYRALLCCDAPSVVVQGWTPVGPEGACVGGFWTAYIGYV